MNQEDAYTTLAVRHHQANSRRYRRILEILMTPLQARIAVLLPATPEELSLKLNTEPDRIKKEIDDLFVRGVVLAKDFRTREGARFGRDVMQLHDAAVSDVRLDTVKDAGLLDAWNDFSREEWYPQLAEEYSKREVPVDRVIPAYQSVRHIPGLTPFDDVREIIKAASLMAVVPCACRRRARHKTPLETCLQFGRSAEYAIVRGSGRQISHDEALEIIELAEEEGQVHTWPNVKTLSYGVMCNCTSDACVIWTPAVQKGLSPLIRAVKSRFEARVDPELCTGCQVCVDRCQFDAIDLVKVPGSKKMKAVVDPAKCGGCGVCVLKCEPSAISMALVRPLEHIPDVRPVYPR